MTKHKTSQVDDPRRGQARHPVRKIADDEVLRELGRLSARASLGQICAQFGAERGRDGCYTEAGHAAYQRVGRALQRLQRAGKVSHHRGAGAGWSVT